MKYADRAKQIKNAAVVNENPQDKLIRELKEENEKLKKQLALSGGPAQVITKEDEEAKKQLAIMQETLEANQRQMAEMEKSWEQKLAEAKAMEAEEEEREKIELEKKKVGGPHLVNLNEYPILDRKVFYDITAEEPLTIGRRAKDGKHKLQLGGTGIMPNHAKIEMINGTWPCMFIPLDEKALPHIRVNGKLMKDMKGQQLKPNDRICLGPSAMFLYKNKLNEANCSMPDPIDDPIQFDFASEEVIEADNEGQKEEKEAMKKMQEEMAAKAVEDMKA